jgi:hypothetical protein
VVECEEDIIQLWRILCFIGFGFWVSEKSEGSSCAEETSAHGDAGFSSDWRLGHSPGICGFCELDLSIWLQSLFGDEFDEEGLG